MNSEENKIIIINLSLQRTNFKFKIHHKDVPSEPESYTVSALLKSTNSLQDQYLLQGTYRTSTCCRGPTGPVLAAGLQSTGPVLAAGDLQSTGPVLAAGDLQSTGPVLAAGDLQSTGPVLAAGDLQSTGPVLAAGDLQSTGPVLAAGDLQYRTSTCCRGPKSVELKKKNFSVVNF